MLQIQYQPSTITHQLGLTYCNQLSNIPGILVFLLCLLHRFNSRLVWCTYLYVAIFTRVIVCYVVAKVQISFAASQHQPSLLRLFLSFHLVRTKYNITSYVYCNMDASHAGKMMQGRSLLMSNGAQPTASRTTCPSFHVLFVVII